MKPCTRGATLETVCYRCYKNHSTDYNQPVFRHVRGLKDPEDVTINSNTHFTRLTHLGHILSLCVNIETDCDVPFLVRRDVSNKPRPLPAGLS